MNLAVFKVLGSVSLCTESNVSLFVDPGSEWLEVCPKDPLPDIKLFFPDDEGSFDVFLNNPRNLTPDNVFKYFVEVVEGFNPPPS